MYQIRQLPALLRDAYRDIHQYEGAWSFARCLAGTFFSTYRTSKRLTVLTFTICPPNVRLWLACMNAAAHNADYFVGDSTGALTNPDFPAPTVPLLNMTHGHKIDLCLRRHINSEYVLLCDDDVFMLNSIGLDWAVQQLDANPRVAAVSLRPRARFTWPLNGVEQRPMGTYCLLFRRSLILQERLSFRTVHQPSPTPNSYQGEYDTGDFANVELLRRGYEILSLPDEMMSQAYVAFFGLSSAIITVRREHTNLASLNEDKKSTVYAALYTHERLRELYTHLFGTQPDWSILPDRAELESFRLLEGLLTPERCTALRAEIDTKMNRLINGSQIA